MEKLFTPRTDARVLVVGDIILDRYVHGDTSRISPEAPVPVVLVKLTEDRPGGACNVASNIASLGLQVNLAGITGDDQDADRLVSLLGDQNIDCSFYRQSGYPTITKFRIISQHQQLLRLDYEADSTLANPSALKSICNEISEKPSVIVFSDYNKGSLSSISEFISIFNPTEQTILVDPKGDDFSRYKGASLLTPNLKEFEYIVGPCTDLKMLEEKGARFCSELLLKAILVTRGEHGMSLLYSDKEPLHLETMAREVFDVTGAGDTVIAGMAAAIASGYDLEQAAVIANRAAGIVVGKLGTATVTLEELNDVPTEHHSVIIPDRGKINNWLKKVRSEGKKIVMTNGCFDILHAGHVNYLNQAKQLGDVLIIAVNDDNSVKNLKGKNRPINKLAQRMQVLAALNMVDCVVPFSEDTPLNLVKIINPDVLVKGGDYQIKDIVGAPEVIKNGGVVKTIPIVEEVSTSYIIKKISDGDHNK